MTTYNSLSARAAQWYQTRSWACLRQDGSDTPAQGDKIMSDKHPAARLAVDIGGTFTDIVLLAADRRFVAKVLTTPKAPETAVIDGTRAALAAAGLAFADIGVLVHGTTLATNA